MPAASRPWLGPVANADGHVTLTCYNPPTLATATTITLPLADGTPAPPVLPLTASANGQLDVGATDARIYSKTLVGTGIVNNIGLVASAGGIWVHSSGGNADEVGF